MGDSRLPSPGDGPGRKVGEASTSEVERDRSRRAFIRTAAVGSAITVLGGAYHFSGVAAHAKEKRPDGRVRVPPGQRVLEALKPMGGQPGSPLRADVKLRIAGEVDAPAMLSFEELLALGSEELSVDVHCVTGWSVLGARFRGVRMRTMAQRVRPRSTARYVIFEGAHGYTANVPLSAALAPNALLAHELGGRPLRRAHGAPVRAVVPDLYFWKSAKWLTGIRFVARDEPGYWERRGYHNHGDPWREERYG